jgi:hypothetical protein
MSPYSYSGYDVTASLVSSRKLALGLQNVEDDTLSSEGDAWDTEGWDNDLLVRSRVTNRVSRVCRVSCVVSCRVVCAMAYMGWAWFA